MMPSGHKAFVVSNPSDVDLLLMHNKTFAAEISHSVSSRKRVDIIAKAKQLGVKVTNAKARVTTEWILLHILILLCAANEMANNNGWSVRNKKRATTSHPVTERRRSEKLPDTPARTRFAPSPTGYLHLGSLRTALFNYLIARATRGQFILRIEDTDKKRLVNDAEQRLFADMRWAGLHWDEGPDVGGPYGPYRQSERTDLYHKHAEKLLGTGHAYRCFCSSERLDSLAKERHAFGRPSSYDRRCVNILTEHAEERAARGESHVVRLKMPERVPSFHDIIYGSVKERQSAVENGSHSAIPGYEDPILVKSDGLPTYHLANVVDDHHMGITHVIRATEWMASTPKHMVIYDAFGWKSPVYAHVGLLQDSEGRKLSKRFGSHDLSVRFYAESGVLPEALINFVALLGWSHISTVDFLRMQDLIHNFDLKFTKGNSKVDPGKLLYLQKRYAQIHVKERSATYEGMVNAVHDVAIQHLKAHPESRIKRDDQIVPLVRALLSTEPHFYTTPREFFERYIYLFCATHRAEWSARRSTECLSLADCQVIKATMTKIPENDWNADSVNQAIEQITHDIASKHTSPIENGSGKRSLRGQSLHYLRWALTGGRPGPSLADLMVLMGRELTLHRLETGEIEYRSLIEKAEAPAPP
ncbi:MAG: hypothetical protein Q9163_001832 [Psora crenata]